MLILTRKTGEAIRIGDAITLRIIEVRGAQVRIGVEAPRSIGVHREEIYALIQEQNRQAASSSPLSAEALDTIWQESGAPRPAAANGIANGPSNGSAKKP